MATYREIVYMVLDELKLFSGDSDFTEEHILFLIEKLRAYLINQKATSSNGSISSDNKQEIKLKLIQVPAIPGIDCYGNYLKSTIKVPSFLDISTPTFTTVDFISNIRIVFVPLERMPYVGETRWDKDFIFVSIGNDGYLYLKSNNPQAYYLKSLRMSAIFSDIQSVAQLGECSCSKECDILDNKFPLEESLITLLINSACRELSQQRYMPKDKNNNSSDDMSSMASASPRNMQQQYARE